MPLLPDFVPLPSPDSTGPVPVEDTIAHRRTIRNYTDAALNLRQVGQLLWAAQGVTAPMGFRTAPSAGALHPLGVSLVAGHVDALSPGVYRYLPEPHALDLIATGDRRRSLAAAALGQSWVADAPVALVIHGVYRRTTGKYGDRGIRYTHIEAGCATENVLLQAVALGLGAATVGAFSDATVADIVEMTGDGVPLCILPVGHGR